ncbi:hypothetical protein CSUI_004811 [Cystoisospora suis]|uniref:Secreted protein n=1 Tax=Cystoisospora suis TaxID=483139 RepID=A0A2C6L076_9APIC|nr:hypothetical protein CSUI_004811 [Cystoisospora suis]
MNGIFVFGVLVIFMHHCTRADEQALLILARRCTQRCSVASSKYARSFTSSVTGQAVSFSGTVSLLVTFRGRRSPPSHRSRR